MPGAGQKINEFRKHKLPIVIVTTAGDDELETAKEELEFLQGLPGITRDDVTNLKPDPEPLLKAMELIGANPSNTVFIGDFRTDIQAGKAANVMTIGLTGVVPEISAPELEAEEPDLLLQYLSEIEIGLD